MLNKEKCKINIIKKYIYCCILLCFQEREMNDKINNRKYENSEICYTFIREFL